MGSIIIFMPLSTFLEPAPLINLSSNNIFFLWNFFQEWWELNPEPLGSVASMLTIMLSCPTMGQTFLSFQRSSKDFWHHQESFFLAIFQPKVVGHVGSGNNKKSFCFQPKENDEKLLILIPHFGTLTVAERNRNELLDWHYRAVAEAQV